MATDRNRRTRCAIAAVMEGGARCAADNPGRTANQVRNPRARVP